MAFAKKVYRILHCHVFSVDFPCAWLMKRNVAMQDPPLLKRNQKGCVTILRGLAVAFGLLLVIAGPVLLVFQPKSQAGWATMFAGLIFMVASRFEEIQEIGLASFSAKMFERRVGRAEDAIQNIKRLAKESSRLALASIQFAGRMGGFTDEYKTRVLTDTRRLLDDLDITEEEIAEAESLWHAAGEFDYAHWTLGQSKVPKDLPQEFRPRWDNLRGGGVEGRAKPEEIRVLLSDADMLTPERDEILKDYEYYVATRQHRREEAWRRRREQN